VVGLGWLVWSNQGRGGVDRRELLLFMGHVSMYSYAWFAFRCLPLFSFFSLPLTAVGSGLVGNGHWHR